MVFFLVSQVDFQITSGEWGEVALYPLNFLSLGCFADQWQGKRGISQ